MSLESLARLEELVDKMLSDREQMQKRNLQLQEELKFLQQERARISEELGKLLDKLERL